MYRDIFFIDSYEIDEECSSYKDKIALTRYVFRSSSGTIFEIDIPVTLWKPEETDKGILISLLPNNVQDEVWQKLKPMYVCQGVIHTIKSREKDIICYMSCGGLLVRFTPSPSHYKELSGLSTGCRVIMTFSYMK